MTFSFPRVLALAIIAATAQFAVASVNTATIEAHLDKTDLHVGEKATLRVLVSWDRSNYVVAEAAPPPLVGLKLVNKTTRLASDPAIRDVFKREFIYEMIATEAGAGKIGVVEIGVLDPYTGNFAVHKTRPFEVGISSYRWSFILLHKGTAAAILGLIATGIIAVAAIKRRGARTENTARKEKPVKITKRDIESLQATFENDLAAASLKKYADDVPGYYSAAETAFINWLNARHGFDIEKLNHAVVNDLVTRNVIETTDAAFLKETASRSDAVKSGAEKPTMEEIKNLVARFEAIVKK